MASIAITSSMLRACSSSHLVTNKQQSQTGPARSLGTTQATQVVTPNIEGKKGLNIAEQQQNHLLLVDKAEKVEGESKHDLEAEYSVPQFFDERWKNGTWDLNMFVRNGRMDWDGVIVAEAKRRKFLELYPEVASEQAPIHFRSSIVPWWAWIMHSHLPEAELLNGRAAMVGFFMAYFVDALTGLDVVGQTGNIICKIGLFATILGVVVFRRSQDFEKLKYMADEATFYDKQWQASWQDQDASNGGTLEKR
ncbi:hypothetical protein RJ639_033093 [Escallonia herrerae]|uniref:Light-harvesting complex-like protein 3 isotype 1, chloroplastic n=1 Tax=Escallonia herrerae TaxID=1293975 RepID=A0AA88WSD5_9ASTE|nr:hypothetical protein RJ639_033093 [Escallonia herrerae]